MTYGVYTRDLKSVRVSNEFGFDVCKQYCNDDYVICSERKIWGGWSIKFHFHKWFSFRIFPRYGIWHIGFVDIECQTYRYTWADKIVYDPKKEAR